MERPAQLDPLSPSSQLNGLSFEPFSRESKENEALREGSLSESRILRSWQPPGKRLQWEGEGGQEKWNYTADRDPSQIPCEWEKGVRAGEA